MRKRFTAALVIALGLETAVLTVLAIESQRDGARIRVLSEELYNVPDPLRATSPRNHENYLEDLEQRQADVERRLDAIEGRRP